MSNYDCTNDVKQHQDDVKIWLREFEIILHERGEIHDDSKLTEPEKSCYDKWKPVLEITPFGTPEYDMIIAQMGEGLQAHFRNNAHHPEHYIRGISGMTLFDVVEMFCDWMAVSQRKNVPIALDYLAKKFNISEQLKDIFVNTIAEELNT